MFDFMDSDAFIIGFEIFFLSFVVFDAWKYYKTGRKAYIVNIIAAIGFALWVLVPFYTKYYDWTPEQRAQLDRRCLSENNATYCQCVDNLIEKAYTHETYTKIAHKRDNELLAFIKEAEEECFEDSWF